MDQELVPDQDMPSDDSFEQAVRDEGDVADTAATEIKTARSKESKKTGGENMEALVEGGRSVKVARLHEAPASYAKSKQFDCTAKVTDYAVTNYNETMKSVSALLNQTHYDLSTLNRSQGMKYIAMCGRDSSSITFQVPSS